MTIFEEISCIKEKIRRTQEKIELLEMKIDSPRSCEISDMPRGGGNAGNPLEVYVEKKEELTEKLDALETKLEKLWYEALNLMKAANIDQQVQAMMYFRFIYGLQWERVAYALSKRYAGCKWNVNKCFRKYREVLCRIRRL